VLYCHVSDGWYGSVHFLLIALIHLWLMETIMNVKKIFKTLGWCQVADWLVPPGLLGSASTVEEANSYRALNQIFSYGFMPFVAGMAYVLILGKIFPFVKHLINDTNMMNCYAIFFLAMVIGLSANLFHKVFKMFRASGEAMAGKKENTMKPYGLTTHNEHLQESALLDIVHHTFSSSSLQSQKERSVEKT
jgi:hypothetical protein